MSHIAVFNNKKAFLRKLLIFLVFSAIILLSFVSCEKTEDRKSAETETAEKAETEHVTETETSAATETYVTDDNFVTIGGVLTEYKGSDTVVTIPDYVTEIADHAFENAPNADKITEIRLGRGITKISAKAFFGLDVLTKIESAQNPFFITEFQKYDNAYALYSKDQPVIFYFPDKEMHSITYATENEYYEQNEKIILAASDALFEIGFEEDVNDGNRYWYVSSITYNGTVKNFEANESFGAPLGKYAFNTNEAFVFMKQMYNASDAYFFVDDKVFEKKNLFDYAVGYSISFYSENENLKYIKMASNYGILTSGVSTMTMCFYEIESREEFCAEYGRVEITDSGLKYIPEKTYNISEYLEMRGTSIDECFENYYYASEYDTLDELIAANKNRLTRKDE